MKNCLECGDELFGRVDKKYCNDQCRNSYNNRLNGVDDDYVRKVNGTLRKNRKVLMALNPKGTTKVDKEKLLKAGFDFGYFTNTYTTKDNRTYYYCYDYGYIEIEDQLYALVKKKEWVD